MGLAMPIPKWTRAILFCVFVLSAMPCASEPRTVAQGRVIKLTLPAGTDQATGTITSYTPLLFTVTTDQGEQHRVLWNAIPADKVDRYWRYLEQPQGDAQGLFELGTILVRHRNGQALAKQAFDQALALDPALAQAIEPSLAGHAPDAAPRYEGNADPAMWGDLSKEVMEQGAQTLRRFAQRTQRELGMELKLYESDRFILLTDTDAKQVESLSAKLAQGYRAVAELLGDDPDDNVFVGKCLIVLFDQRVDYIRFQDQLHDTDARGTGGLCHGFGNGHIHIAAFKRNSPRQTNHVVVHELAHAYLRRHKTPQQVDDWINEGLAEHLAHQIEPPSGQNIYLKARLALEDQKGLGAGFFEGENLDAWQYDVAGALAGYMIERLSLIHI